MFLDDNMTARVHDNFIYTVTTATVYNYRHCSDKVLHMIFGFSIRELKNMHIRAWRDLADQLYNYNRLTAVSAIIIVHCAAQ